MWRQIPLGVAAPFVLIVVAAIAWSGVWYFETAAIGARVDAWRAENAANGLALACAEEGAGGYPFRLSYECTRPVIDVTARRASFRLTAERLSAVALVYDPEHLIIEIDAPAMLERGLDGVVLVAGEHGQVRASAEFVGGALARLSVVAPRLAFLPGGEAPLTAEAGELHLRARPAEAALDIALKSRNARFAGPGGTDPIDIATFDLIAVINDVPSARLADIDTWAQRWQAAGGVADITRLSLDAPELGAEAAGVVNLTASGHVEGALNARLTRIEAFAEALVRRGVIAQSEGEILRGAAGLIASMSDGRASVSLPIRIRDGEVYIGPVKVWTLPPVT